MIIKYIIKSTLLIFLVLIGFYSFAQENKLKIHASSIGIGIANSSSDSAKQGLGLNFDFLTILDKNLFSFYFNSGSNLNSAGPSENFYELNLTYGRKIELMNQLFLEGHLGVGYFLYDLGMAPIFFINIPDSTIAFPIRAKLIFRVNKNFGLGINPNINFNSIANTYSVNFLLQYNF